MDQQPNAGSFMSAVAPGAGQALKNALARRGITTPGGLNQSTNGVLPSAPPPTPPSGALPPQMSGMPPQSVPVAPTPQPTPQPQAPQPAPGMPGQPPASYGSPEAQLILKAMSDYLSHIQDVNEAQQGVQ